jgi:hypothetical protein
MFVTKDQVEQLIGTKIKNLDLYQKAFTHKSAIKEYETATNSFETLEFMGDSDLLSQSFYLIDMKVNKKVSSRKLVPSSFVVKH